MNVFDENNMAKDVFIAFLSQSKEIRQPCISTIDLIQTMEKLLKRYDSHDVTFNSIITHILKVTDISSFYELSEFEGEHDHKRDFIKMIIEEYFDMKSEYMSKLMTRMSQKKLLRHDKLKEIHRAVSDSIYGSINLKKNPFTCLFQFYLKSHFCRYLNEFFRNSWLSSNILLRNNRNTIFGNDK